MKADLYMLKKKVTRQVSISLELAQSTGKPIFINIPDSQADD